MTRESRINEQVGHLICVRAAPRAARMSRMTAVEDLWKLSQGYRVTQTIYVAAVLGISDHLADGPRDVGWIAEQCDCDPPSLYRLLRALATVGVYEELPGGQFGLTPLGEALRHGVPARSHRGSSTWPAQQSPRGLGRAAREHPYGGKRLQGRPRRVRLGLPGRSSRGQRGLRRGDDVDLADRLGRGAGCLRLRRARHDHRRRRRSGRAAGRDPGSLSRGPRGARGPAARDRGRTRRPGRPGRTGPLRGRFRRLLRRGPRGR